MAAGDVPVLVDDALDDLVEDPGGLLRLLGHHGEAFEGDQIVVDLHLVLDIHGAGEVLGVDHIGQVRFGEPENAEAHGNRIRLGVVADDLHGQVGLRIELLPEAPELPDLDVCPGDRAAQRGLFEDDPQRQLPVLEPPLAFPAEFQAPFGVLGGIVAERDDGGRVVVGLQQVGNELLLVQPDGLREFLHAGVGLGPPRHDVVIAMPPAGPAGLLRQREKSLSLACVSAVEGEQVDDIGHPDGAPPQLDQAELGLLDADLARGLLAGDAGDLSFPSQVAAEDYPENLRAISRIMLAVPRAAMILRFGVGVG